MTANDTGRPGDKLLLTKALGVGLICTANRVGEAAPDQMEGAIRSMTTLNKAAAEIAHKYAIHAATDVTGFSFLGHLHEMMGKQTLLRHRCPCGAGAARRMGSRRCVPVHGGGPAEPQPHRTLRPV